MERLFIEQTSSTPLIRFDPTEMLFRMEGESYPENSFGFYTPILALLKETLSSLPALRAEFNIVYMNSSSTKCVLDLLDILEDAHNSGVSVSVDWLYDRDNPRSLDLAEEFREEVSFPFRALEIEARDTP